MTDTKTIVTATATATATATTHSWQKVARISLYLAVFLLPLFFLPWTGNVFDFNKQMILTVLVSVGVFAWLLKSLIEEKMTINLSWVNIAILSSVLAALLSTLFSAYKYASFWGWPLTVSSGFLTVLVLAGLFFLITHIFRGAKEIFGLVLILLLTGLLVGLFAIPGIFGKSLLPSESNFNTVGTVNSLAFFLASILPLAVSIIFVSKAKLIKALVWAFIAVSLALLLIINSQTAWIVLMLGSAVILIFGIARKGLFQTNWLFLPMFLLAVSLFALVAKDSFLPIVDLPLEVSPGFKSSFDIAFKTMSGFNKPISWLLGSGPSTFIYDYSQFRPLDINQTIFWNTRFGAGFSEIATRLATTGILGLLSFLVIVFGIGFLGLKEIIAKKAEDGETFSWILLLGAFASFVSIAIGFFLYSANMTLIFCFWLVAAIVFGLVSGRQKEFVLQPNKNIQGKSSPWTAVMVSFVFIAVVISSLGILFTQGQRFLAEINYTKAITSVAKGDNAAAQNDLIKAIRLTGSKQDNYWQDLSQVYLFRINEELQRKDVTQEQMTSTVSDLISQLVTSAKATTDASPKNVVNWLTRGLVYGNLTNLINGADEWAIKSYEEAVKLEPFNPLIYTQWGMIYLNRADVLADDKTKAEERSQAMSAAREKFQKALDLKSDYAPARYQLAMIDIREGKTKDAISKLEDTKKIAPYDTGLAFQLGLIYRADNQSANAQAEFERAIALDPSYSNARYFLGLIYDENKEKTKAIEQFEEIAKLNSDNETVKKVLENLKAGKPALQGVTQAQEPPVQEKTGTQLPTPSPVPKAGK